MISIWIQALPGGLGLSLSSSGAPSPHLWEGGSDTYCHKDNMSKDHGATQGNVRHSVHVLCSERYVNHKPTDSREGEDDNSVWLPVWPDRFVFNPLSATVRSESRKHPSPSQDCHRRKGDSGDETYALSSFLPPSPSFLSQRKILGKEAKSQCKNLVPKAWSLHGPASRRWLRNEITSHLEINEVSQNRFSLDACMQSPQTRCKLTWCTYSIKSLVRTGSPWESCKIPRRNLV